jgi:hypothetical protein
MINPLAGFAEKIIIVRAGFRLNAYEGMNRTVLEGDYAADLPIF